MASNSFRVRRLASEREEISGENDSLFSVNRGPVTPKKRDVSQYEDSAQRALVQRMKDAFRTMSFRSKPTIGEEELVLRSDSRISPRECNVQAPIGNEYPLVDHTCEELVQNLVPECYEHIQNFHHYRSDMARLSSGSKVLYLSGDKRTGNSEKEMRRVYGQKSKSRNQNASVNGHFRMLPGSKIRSTRMSDKVSFRVAAPSPKSTDKGRGKFDKDGKANLNDSRARILGKAEKTRASLNGENKQRLQSQEDHGQVNANKGNELPHFKLEQAPENPVESQPSFHSLPSDISGRKPPMTTPDEMSRRSSIRTLVFESEEDLSNSKGNRGSSPRHMSPKGPSHIHHPLTPFYSRLPHLKASCESGSCHTTRQKGCDVTTIPSWQQYRILCDALRPNLSPERVVYQKKYGGYKKPRFATATELEYYIDVVSQSNNNNCALHL